MSSYPILVTAAVIEDRGKFLITQRPADKHNGLRWEFPGGKVEHKEDPRVCLEREIDEELGIKIKADDILDVSSNVYGESKHIVLLGMHCTFLSGDIKKLDIADFAWVTPQEMDSYDITEADLPFIEKLKTLVDK
ncbi:MAG: (deoxy)nucleoside triphosphate pyrophosphohydrolase [Nanoarchaeota archaeon]|nr:(deoxy)nucleoside triphosphate pyrophosphohydrolase [Nanoarchaeota archaeon]